MKTSRPSFHQQPLNLTAYPQDEKLWVVMKNFSVMLYWNIESKVLIDPCIPCFLVCFSVLRYTFYFRAEVGGLERVDNNVKIKQAAVPFDWNYLQLVPTWPRLMCPPSPSDDAWNGPWYVALKEDFRGFSWGPGSISHESWSGGNKLEKISIKRHCCLLNLVIYLLPQQNALFQYTALCMWNSLNTNV